MISVDQFFKNNNGKFVDFDLQLVTLNPDLKLKKDNPFQCKDLFNYYNRDVVGGTRVYGNAKDLWTNFPEKFYTRINNTRIFIPKRGDVMIWGMWGANPYGHVGIVESANMFTFTSFDQNYPLATPCHFQKHNYISPRVLGVLRPKV